MASNYDQIPTFLGYSEQGVGVIIGGVGFDRYSGLVFHEPTDAEFDSVIQNPEDTSSNPKGIGLSYDQVATVTVAGLLKWTNWNLSRWSRDNQSVREASAPVRIEIFDTEQQREYVETHAKLFERLGIQFIG